jgi:F-type H+-transporting ATPase subunit b
VLTAVATLRGNSVEVRFVGAEEGEEESHSDVEPKDGPSPIAPEIKELVWTSGAFIVFALLMRYFLYPRLKSGMEARYAGIRAGHEGADAARAAARAEVAEYETQLSTVRAEANDQVEVARRTLEAERTERLAEVNARIDERRQAALADAEAARAAARGEIETAASEVVTRAVELATGRPPDPAAVGEAVSTSMMEGAAR